MNLHAHFSLRSFLAGVAATALFCMIFFPATGDAITTKGAKILPSPSAVMTPELWLQDFHQLIDEMSAHDANLEWSIAAHHLNLAALKQHTDDALRSSTSDESAHAAIETFLHAFGDDSLTIRWPPPEAPTVGTVPLCTRLHYEHETHDAGVFAAANGYMPFRDEDARTLPSGILRISAARTIGIIRIARFSPYDHPELCETARETAHLPAFSGCNAQCADDLEVAVANLLTSTLERRARELRASGARAIIVDVSGSDGDTSWAEVAARTLTSIRLHSSRIALVTHPHWVKTLDEQLATIRTDLTANEPANQDELVAGEIAVDKARSFAAQSCDRSTWWSDPPQQPTCSALVRDTLYASGALAYAKPGAFAGLASQATLFTPSRYRYTEGSNHLPLIVVTDRTTSETAAYFAALLEDNRAAKLIGQTTAQANCVEDDGGIMATLVNSNASVMMSDCVWFREDGTTETIGVPPTVSVPWRSAEPPIQRAADAVRTLQRLLPEPAKRR